MQFISYNRCIEVEAFAALVNRFAAPHIGRIIIDHHMERGFRHSMLSMFYWSLNNAINLRYMARFGNHAMTSTLHVCVSRLTGPANTPCDLLYPYSSLGSLVILHHKSRIDFSTAHLIVPGSRQAGTWLAQSPYLYPHHCNI